MIITPQAEKTLFVVTRQPILLQAQDFGLDGGTAKLLELVGLKVIASSVLVTFSLSLNADKNKRRI